jgi:acyl-CoA thioester hydrolase
VTRETRVRIDVRWRDLDMLGHLNQAVYHEYLEEGRAALLEQLGRLGDFAFVLAKVELNYRHEIRKDHGHVEILSAVTTVGRSSITIENRLLVPDGTVAAEGTTVLVAWDADARRAAGRRRRRVTALAGAASRWPPRSPSGR